MTRIKDGAAIAQHGSKKMRAQRRVHDLRQVDGLRVAALPDVAALELRVASFTARDVMIFPLHPWKLQGFAGPWQFDPRVEG